MKIGIYGGTFNPPHRGHSHVAQCAVEQLALDRLLVIPDDMPPHKELPKGSPTRSQRFAMTELAMGGIKNASVSDLELQRGGKSYTVDTLQMICRQEPDAELFLLMGSDMLEIFSTWHEPETILSLATIVSFQRGGEGEQARLLAAAQAIKFRFGKEVRLLDIQPWPAASSDVRQEISKKATLLSAPVYGYILREHLYGTDLDLKHLSPEQLQPIALSYLNHKRMAHVLGTQEEAIRLARRYGADETQARVAALLHDCTKKLDMQQQMELCRKYHIELDPLEQTALKLLHAKTGAEIARNDYGVDDAVYEAIKWHTTGKADMTLLEKVIYLADYIEPNRDFHGVDTLRKAVYEDLNGGLALGLQMTIEEMTQMGAPVHHNTVEALHFLKG